MCKYVRLQEVSRRFDISRLGEWQSAFVTANYVWNLDTWVAYRLESSETGDIIVNDDRIRRTQDFERTRS